VSRESSSRSRYGSASDQSLLTRPFEFIRRSLRRSNSKALGASLRAFDRVASLTRPKHLPTFARVIISVCQPIDPLRWRRLLPPIDLVVPFVEKDLRSLHLVIGSAVLNVRNPLARIILITPQNQEGTGPRFREEDSQKRLEEVLADYPLAEIRFDQDVLGAQILDELEVRFGLGDRNAGWVNQQLIKLSAAAASTEQASLILDADTVLLSRKVWLTGGGRQLLQVANEYHREFMTHVYRYFGVPKILRMSYVTHHQLMQTDVVRSMFPSGAVSLIDWWKSSSDPIGRDLGDYEAYGSYLVHHFPKRVSFGSFSNLFSPHLETFLQDLASTSKSPSELIPDYCSVSFHSWAQADRAVRGD